MPLKPLVVLFLLSVLASASGNAADPQKPPITTREAWGAANAITPRLPAIKESRDKLNPIYAENLMATREPAVYLTVHYSIYRPEDSEPPGERLQRLQKLYQSREKGSYYIETKVKDKKGRVKKGRKTIYMADIPYHFVIAPSGEILEGREIKYAARSNTVYDKTLPNDTTPPEKKYERPPISYHITVLVEGDFDIDEPTETQHSSLTNLLHWLAVEYNIKVNNITHHRMVADTTCPGRHMIEVMPRIRKKLSSLGVAGDPNAPCDGCLKERIDTHIKDFGAGNF